MVVANALAVAALVPAQNPVFSTHDQTISVPALELLFDECWADVKMPGTSMGALQFGFPPAAPFAYITGVEYWLGSGPPATFVALGSNRVFRMALSPLPAPGGLVSAQLVCFVPTPVTGPAAGCSSTETASPALWFSW